jgi:hypothetical protein
MSSVMLFRGKEFFSVTGFVTSGRPWLEFHLGFRFWGDWLAGLRLDDPFGDEKVIEPQSGCVKSQGKESINEGS